MRKLPASKCLASEPTAACYTNKNRPVHCQNLASLIFLLQRRTSQSICGRKVGEIPFRARRCSCFAWLTSMFDNERGILWQCLAWWLESHCHKLACKLWPNRKRICSSFGETLPPTVRDEYYKNIFLIFRCPSFFLFFPWTPFLFDMNVSPTYN